MYDNKIQRGYLSAKGSRKSTSGTHGEHAALEKMWRESQLHRKEEVLCGTVQKLTTRRKELLSDHNCIGINSNMDCCMWRVWLKAFFYVGTEYIEVAFGWVGSPPAALGYFAGGRGRWCLENMEENVDVDSTVDNNGITTKKRH